ncbi:hypothetical protein CFAM422_009543 [Trichoderma lentiforme]|uniref:Uncharacterized protein n=1 Tax=Trichoderma lentiforme TaxID=1567552 RepID=A0A9P5CBH5_9HYPO|nr:hypothetical protein CFAM422_009543 [Trichoderma lentiforme]
MSIKYTITLHNDHGKDGRYAFFVDPPQVSESLIAPEVFTNAWISTFVPNGSTHDITTTSEMFAWCGTVPKPPCVGVTVHEGASQPAALGYKMKEEITPGGTFEMIVDRGVPDLIPIPSSAKAAAYKIETGSDLPTPNYKYLFGLGMTNGCGLVSPVASAVATNNMSITLTPIMKFHVSQSDVETGEIIDLPSVSKKAGAIDFSSGLGAGKDAATVVHKSNGTFDIIYHENYKN